MTQPVDFNAMKNAAQIGIEKKQLLSNWKKVSLLLCSDSLVLYYVGLIFIRGASEILKDDKISLKAFNAKVALVESSPIHLFDKEYYFNLKRAILASIIHFYVAAVDKAPRARSLDEMIEECRRICDSLNKTVAGEEIKLEETHFFLAVALSKKAIQQFEEKTNPAKCVDETLKRKSGMSFRLFKERARTLLVKLDAATTCVSSKTKAFIEKMNVILNEAENDMVKAVKVFALFQEEGLVQNGYLLKALRKTHILDENQKPHLPLFFSSVTVKTENTNNATSVVPPIL